MSDIMTLDVPDLGITLFDGCRVKLGKFESTVWVLHHGWYSWGGNRPFCGWYLINLDDPTNVKPLQKNDLDDIYIVMK